MTNSACLDTPATKVTIEVTIPRLKPPIFGTMQGKFVAVRKAGKDEKTKLGLYLGDLPLGVHVTHKKSEPDHMVIMPGMSNPAIYVFEDKQIVYGVESWWSGISSPEQLKEITDDDINNVWYVQALKQLMGE